MIYPIKPPEIKEYPKTPSTPSNNTTNEPNSIPVTMIPVITLCRSINRSLNVGEKTDNNEIIGERKSQAPSRNLTATHLLFQSFDFSFG